MSVCLSVSLGGGREGGISVRSTDACCVAEIVADRGKEDLPSLGGKAGLAFKQTVLGTGICSRNEDRK